MSHDAASFSKKVNKMSTRKRGRHVGSGLVVDRDKKKNMQSGGGGGGMNAKSVFGTTLRSGIV